jgi:hypothetical protein
MNSVVKVIDGQPLDDAALEAVSGGSWGWRVVEHVLVHYAIEAVEAGVEIVKDGLNAVAAAAESGMRAQGSPRQ